MLVYYIRGSSVVVCTICHQEFRTQRQLIKHQKLHSQKKPDPNTRVSLSDLDPKSEAGRTCPHCNKVFTSKGIMVRHTRLHYHKPYPCTHCEKAFIEKNKLYNHLVKRHGIDPTQLQNLDCKTHSQSPAEGAHVCSDCKIEFNSLKLYKAHTCTEKKPLFFCEECNEFFPRKSYLIEHQETWHKNENSFELKIDDNLQFKTSAIHSQKVTSQFCKKVPFKSFQTERHKLKKKCIEHLNRPSKNNSERAQYVCQYCSACFYNKSIMTWHTKLHNNLVIQSCPICSSIHWTEKSLQIHMKHSHQLFIEGMMNKVSCTLCRKSFKSRSQLKVHMIKRHKRYFCYRCEGKGYSSSTMLTKHIMQVHRAAQQNRLRKESGTIKTLQYKCASCRLYFPTKASYDKHQKCNHRQQYICELCAKLFNKKYRLIHHHQFVHIGKKHECHLCKKCYHTEKYLEKHLEQHRTNTLPVRKKPRLTERPYCKECDRYFAQWGGLTRHMRQHDKSGHFCEFCGKHYAEAIKLRQHVDTVHKNVRWQCDICYKEYTTERYLKEHKNEHNQEFKYFCRVCKRGFSYKGRCTQHERRHKCLNPSKAQEISIISQQSQEATKPIKIEIESITTLTKEEDKDRLRHISQSASSVQYVHAGDSFHPQAVSTNSIVLTEGDLCELQENGDLVIQIPARIVSTNSGTNLNYVQVANDGDFPDIGIQLGEQDYVLEEEIPMDTKKVP